MYTHYLKHNLHDLCCRNSVETKKMFYHNYYLAKNALTLRNVKNNTD